MKLAHDTWLIFQRHSLLVIRARTYIFFALAQPVTYVLLFAPLLKLALRSDGVTTYTQAYQIYVPGLLTVMAIVGGAYTGFGLLRELRGGIIERARVTPVSRLSLMLGRALREVAVLEIQAVVITLLALPFGLRVPIGDLLLAYLLLGLLSLSAVSVSYAITLTVRNVGALASADQLDQPAGHAAGGGLAAADAGTGLAGQHRAVEPVLLGYQRHALAVQRRPSRQNDVWIGMIIVVALTIVTVNWSVRVFAKPQVGGGRS